MTFMITFTEMCLPGLKAIISIAKNENVDLEMIELEPMEKLTYTEDLAKLSVHVKKGAQVEELMTLVKEGNFSVLKDLEHQVQIIEVANRLGKATVSKVLIQEVTEQKQKGVGIKSLIKVVQQGKETLEEVIMDVSKEFGTNSKPLKEMAAVGMLLSEGVTCDEVVTMLNVGMLPALQAPEAQVPMTSIVTKKGHSGVVCEVLVEESTNTIENLKPVPESAKLLEYKNLLHKAVTSSTNVQSKSVLKF